MLSGVNGSGTRETQDQIPALPLVAVGLWGCLISLRLRVCREWAIILTSQGRENYVKGGRESASPASGRGQCRDNQCEYSHSSLLSVRIFLLWKKLQGGE